MDIRNLSLRWITFIGGLFVMAFGVALSVRAGLGVSPISCIPYVYSLRFPLTMGEMTILFNVLLVLLQIVVLGRKYELFQLIQIPVIFLFGFFTDATLWMIPEMPNIGYAWQMLLCLASCLVIGLGVFIEVKAGVTYLAGEGLALAIAKRFGVEFGKSKIGIDSSMVIVGILSSLVMLGTIVGTREGTVIAALLVGFLARCYSRRLTFLDRLTKPEEPRTQQAPANTSIEPTLVITISREFGSGGRDIGRLVAQKLGLPFYDKDIIKLTAEESGFTTDYISEHEQKLAHSLLFSLYEQNYAYVNEQLPPLDALFLVQSHVLREISEKHSCVIVGRCANFVLKGHPNCFSVFIHANSEFKKERYISVYNGKRETAESELKEIDHERFNYCKHFTGQERGKAANYDLSLNSSLLGIEKSANIIVEAIQMAKAPSNTAK